MHQRADFGANFRGSCNCIILDTATDPCMGSGHILSYMFDVLVEIYEDYGYTVREAVENIVEKNLWGLDIDERAAQLSYFAVMMKARQYDRRFLSRSIQPHVYAVEESNGITSAPMHDMGIELSQEEHEKAVKETMRLVEEMHNVKEYGSIINVTPCDWNLLRRFAVPRGSSEGQMQLDIHGEIEASKRLQVLIDIGETLSQKYDAVVTNPPYMGAGGMALVLSDYVKSNYPDTKSDLSTVFMEKNVKLCSSIGYVSMINIPVWMFLSSYEKLRETIVENNTYVNMLHLGRGVFGSDFGTTAFVIRKSRIRDYKATYQKLFERQGAVDSLETKLRWFLEGKGLFIEKQENYLEIPGTPVAYSLGSVLIKAFTSKNLVSTVGDVKQGLATGDNNRFLRFWWEVKEEKINFMATSSRNALESRKKWFPYNKGGAYRKWYGNIEYVVNWENDGFEIKNIRDNKGKLRSRPQNLQYFFREGLTWSKVTIGGISMRYVPVGTVFDVAGCSLFPHKDIFVMLANMNSCVQKHILSVFSQSVNYEVGQIAALPIIDPGEKTEEIQETSTDCVELSKHEWDSFETSWNFKRHPIVPMARERQEQKDSQFALDRMKKYSLILWHYEKWTEICEHRFNTLKQNEEKLNNLFIDIYGLRGEIESSIEDKDITVRKADLQRDIRSLISYAVGCMFGRYSLDVPGLAYAGGEWEASKYKTFLPDKDAIIPICDDEYFEDDIVGRFVKFIEVVYGKETLEENLKFIADALGGKGTSREVIRNYFMNDFYADHLKVYQKRPIYWLFDSGKKNGFKCLIYMHRYQPDTIARIRTDYVHEQQSRYRTAIADLEQRINGASTSERVKLNKQLTKLQAQAAELREYEEKIHHLADQMISIDLDDGVKVNYAKFQDVLAKIK